MAPVPDYRVVDNRKTVQEPGIHALIVGVSNYVNLPDHDDPPRKEKWLLNQLTSPALSALKIFDFLQQNPLRLPIKTIRLLLAPSLVEVRAEPRLLTVTSIRPNQETFKQFARSWRDDANTNPDDMTIFYFAGHGVQRGDDGVLLLEDFRPDSDLPLDGSCEIGNIRGGMGRTAGFANIAMTQFYFVDACRTQEETLKNFLDPKSPPVFGVQLTGPERRVTPTMFSTVDGGFALGQDGKPSHFATALERAFLHGADESMDLNGRSVWPVTSVTIARSLELYYQNKKLGGFSGGGGVMGTPVFRYLADPPDVDIAVQIQPDKLSEKCGIEIHDENGGPVGCCGPTAESQYETIVKAGIYRIELESGLLTSSPYRSELKYLTQKVFWPWKHNLTRLLRPPPP